MRARLSFRTPRMPSQAAARAAAEREVVRGIRLFADEAGWIEALGVGPQIAPVMNEIDRGACDGADRKVVVADRRRASDATCDERDDRCETERLFDDRIDEDEALEVLGRDVAANADDFVDFGAHASEPFGAREEVMDGPRERGRGGFV